MTIEDLEKLAAGDNSNTYYLAYAMATGAVTCHEAWKRDGNGCAYICWIDARWAELAAIEGVARDMISNGADAYNKMMALLVTKIAA